MSKNTQKKLSSQKKQKNWVFKLSSLNFFLLNFKTQFFCFFHKNCSKPLNKLSKKNWVNELNFFDSILLTQFVNSYFWCKLTKPSFFWKFFWKFSRKFFQNFFENFSENFFENFSENFSENFFENCSENFIQKFFKKRIHKTFQKKILKNNSLIPTKSRRVREYLWCFVWCKFHLLTFYLIFIKIEFTSKLSLTQNWVTQFHFCLSLL